MRANSFIVPFGGVEREREVVLFGGRRTVCVCVCRCVCVCVCVCVRVCVCERERVIM